MKWKKLMRAATSSILRNRMRSLLTILGVIIGVGAVIVMVTVGQGAQKDIEDRISSLGANMITVSPPPRERGGVSRGFGGRSTLTLEDVEVLRQQATRLSAISAFVRTGGQVVGGSGNWSTSVNGVSPDYPAIRDWDLEEGVFFTERDVQARRKVAVLGKAVADALFPDGRAVGQRIRVGSVPFQVIGVLKEKGQAGMGGNQDDVVLAPATTVFYRLSGKDNIDMIYASATSEADLSAAQTEIETILRAQHKLRAGQANDFQINNLTDVVETASSVIGTFTLLLGSIAAVSLVVGGIGIMNIMLVSVTERTREIGIRLAIGAHGSDVLAQFLVEAAMLSLVGGIVGVLSGLGIGYGITNLLDVPMTINPVIIAVAVAFSLAVGLFFGYYPARKAAALDPIQALRYE